MTIQYINNISDGTNTYVIQDPNALTAEDVTSTYSSSGTSPVNGTAVASAISGMGVNNRDGSVLPLWVGSQIQWEQGEVTPWYYWKTNPTTSWSNSTENIASDSDPIKTMIYANGIILVATYLGYIYRSTDNGSTWTKNSDFYAAGSSSGDYIGITYGNNLFVLVYTWQNTPTSVMESGIYYSSDGLNWTYVDTITGLNTSRVGISGGPTKKVAFGNNKFLILVGVNAVLYSSNGMDWTFTNQATGMQNISASTRLIYDNVNNRFLSFDPYSDSTYINLSQDGLSWDYHKLNAGYGSISSCGNKLLSINYNNKICYSYDGLSWNVCNTGSYSTSGISNSYYRPFAYENGVYVCSSRYTNLFYSQDGINWNLFSINPSNNWYFSLAVNEKFLIFSERTNNIGAFSLASLSCYTTDSEPTTTSTVYSAPSTTSTLTVSSVTSGAITLSDNNTYYYDATGNTSTYRTVGEVHPNYLCFITNVGVKIGTTNITPLITTSITSSSTDTEVPSAKAVYDKIEESNS